MEMGWLYLKYWPPTHCQVTSRRHHHSRLSLDRLEHHLCYVLQRTHLDRAHRAVQGLAVISLRCAVGGSPPQRLARPPSAPPAAQDLRSRPTFRCPCKRIAALTAVLSALTACAHLCNGYLCCVPTLNACRSVQVDSHHEE
jgi:hypothetical protein